jgi:hypothetical protein
VDLVKVNLIDTQATQAVLAAAHDVQPRIALIIGLFAHLAMNLSRQHYGIALVLDGFAGDGFTGALAVNVRRIKKVDAGIKGAINDLDGLGFLCSSAKIHAAQTQRANFDSGAT